MTIPRLPRFSAVLALLMISSSAALADGRQDWPGYAWQKVDIADCRVEQSSLACPPYHQKWDWKRNQWVDIAIVVDPVTGTLQLTQQLTNNDPSDDDYVCVTALVVDRSNANIVAHHQNWHMDPGQVSAQSYTYSSPRLGDAARIHIGSRQCRKGAGEDDALYARILSALRP